MEENKIYCGEASDILKAFPKESIDCIITSPPYNELRDYKGYSFNFENIASELVRILKPGGVIVWVVGDQVQNGSETGTSFRQALYFKDDLNMNIHDTMIYLKNSSSFPARKEGNRYSQVFEYMFVFSKGKPKTANLLCDKPNAWRGWVGFGKVKKRIKSGELIEINKKPTPEFSPRTNVWKYCTGKTYSSSDTIAFEHPAIFPEGLAGDNILTWTDENDIILDPFSGSGTTCKMAKLLNRKYIGIDISQEYVDIAIKRLENYNTIEYKMDFDYFSTGNPYIEPK